MESGFLKADSHNLPNIDAIMLADFFSRNTQFESAEIKNVKTMRASRETYGDDAIGYVQLKRDAGSTICTLKAKITPEHRIHNKGYCVTIIVDEDKEEIVSCKCHDCAASSGGCKHGIAVLLWLHRRSEEPSVTSATCYWRASKLSKVGRTMKAETISSLYNSKIPALKPKDGDFLKNFTEDALQRGSHSSIATLSQNENPVLNVSLHGKCMQYSKEVTKDNCNAEDFMEFCKKFITVEDCIAVNEATVVQSKTTKWFQVRFGRITASKIYEASRCKNYDGTLVENLLGATKIHTEAMERGLRLESEVLKVVKEKYKIQLKDSGFIVDPIFGCSPDALSHQYCIEIKCPTKDKTFVNYINEKNEITPKPLAQIWFILCGITNI